MAGFKRTRILKFVGYPAFFIGSFILFLLWTFPIDRFEPILDEQLEKALGREVEIGDLSISLTGNLVLSMIEVSVPEAPEEPSGADDDDDEWDDDESDGESKNDRKDDSSKKKKKPVLKYLIEEMVIDIGFIGLAFGQLDIELDMDFLGGDLEISFEGALPSGGDSAANAAKRADKRRKAQAKKRRQARRPVGARSETDEEGENIEQSEEEDEDEDNQALSFSLVATGLNLRKLHDLRNKSPLPVSGEMDLKIKIRSTTGDFRDADGLIVFTGRNVVFGNGRSKIEVGGIPMSVDEIQIDSLSFEVVFKNGIGQVKKSDVDSRDFDASIEGTITLADPIERSRFNLYLMFKILDGYKDKSASSKALAENMDSFSVELRRAHRTDGYYGFLYRGTFQTARFSPSKRGLARSRKSADRAKRKKNSRKKSSIDRKKTRPRVGAPDRDAELKTPRGVHTGGEDPRGATADRRPLTIPGMDLDARKSGLEGFQDAHGGSGREQEPLVDAPTEPEDEAVEEEEPTEDIHEEAVEEDSPSGEETGENEQAGNPEGANDVPEEE